jgi:segregation and condensation protein A
MTAETPHRPPDPSSPEPAARVEPGGPSGESPTASIPPEAVGNGSSSVRPEGAAAPPVDADGKPLPVEGDGYRVSLDAFEGPLDLLLYLIRREELDVTDIPIARITDQYLATIGDAGVDDLDRAGEYLLMAATLMRIKAKMLIPRDPDDEDDEDEIDPREELVRRLLEYREFKRVAEALGERQEEWRGVFGRSNAPLPENETEEFEDPGVTLVDLFRAFQGILDSLEEENAFEMETEEYSVEEQIRAIRGACLRHPDGLPFTRLFEDARSRALVITTFLALLEMIREREVVADQARRFGEIWLRGRTEVAETHDA